MIRENIHAFERSMGSVNANLEHILNSDNISRENIKKYFDIIRNEVDHCEKLATETEN